MDYTNKKGQPYVIGLDDDLYDIMDEQRKDKNFYRSEDSTQNNRRARE